MYKTLLDILLSAEVNAEKVKKTLNKVNLKDLFERIDRLTSDGFLTTIDVI